MERIFTHRKKSEESAMATVMVTKTNKLTTTILIIAIANIIDTPPRHRKTRRLQLILGTGQIGKNPALFRACLSLSAGRMQKHSRSERRTTASKEKPRLLWAFNPIAQEPAQSTLRDEELKIAHSRLTGNTGNPVVH
jgi:hypothetical protein